MVGLGSSSESGGRDGPGTVELIIVRHGESTNNVVMKELLDRTDLTEDAVKRAWLDQRTQDPPLSAKGQEEAERLGSYLASDATIARGDDVVIYSSPFRRCLQTTLPIATHLNAPVKVHPDIYEVGGCYTQNENDPNMRAGGRGGMTAAQIQAQFPGYNTVRINPTGPWYTGDWETDAVARARIGKVAAWLKSAEFRTEHSGKTVYLVAHGHTIMLLLLTLLGIQLDGARDKPWINNYGDLPVRIKVANTCTSQVKVHPGGDVTVGWLGSTAHLAPPGTGSPDPGAAPRTVADRGSKSSVPMVVLAALLAALASVKLRSLL